MIDCAAFVTEIEIQNLLRLHFFCFFFFFIQEAFGTQFEI